MNEQMQTRQPRKLSFSAYANSKAGQALISNAIRDPRKRDAFVTAIVSAVANNPGLQECTAPSIISAALQGVSMGLAPSPQLGQFYMVPFKNQLKDANGNKLWVLDENGNKAKDANGKWIPATESVATFVPGYKGYIQLAYRSGQYIDLDARPVVEGEYKGLDKYTGRPLFEWIEDDALREQLPVVGYMAYFELVNGARKVLYWSKEKMLNHADRYSPAFSRGATGGRYPKVSFADYEAGNYPKNDEWKYSSFWYKDFDGMAIKTMLRQLITKWGPVSIEMQNAIVQDAENDKNGVDYGAPEGFAGAALPEAPQPEPQPEAPEQPEPESREAVSLDDL